MTATDTTIKTIAREGRYRSLMPGQVKRSVTVHELQDEVRTYCGLRPVPHTNGWQGVGSDLPTCAGCIRVKRRHESSRRYHTPHRSQ